MGFGKNMENNLLQFVTIYFNKMFGYLLNSPYIIV